MTSIETVIIDDLKKMIKEYQDKVSALTTTITIYQKEKKEQKDFEKLIATTAVTQQRTTRKLVQSTSQSTLTRKIDTQAKLKDKKTSKKRKQRRKTISKLTKAAYALQILQDAAKPMKTKEIYQKMIELKYPFSSKSSDMVHTANLYLVLKKEKGIKLLKPGTWALKK